MNHAGPAWAVAPRAADARGDPVWAVTPRLRDLRSGPAPGDGDPAGRPWAADYEEIE